MYLEREWNGINGRAGEGEILQSPWAMVGGKHLPSFLITNTHKHPRTMPTITQVIRGCRH